MLQMKVAHLDRGPAAGQVDLHLLRPHHGRPEQAAQRDSSIEVVYLRRRIPQTGVIDVDSDPFVVADGGLSRHDTLRFARCSKR